MKTSYKQIIDITDIVIFFVIKSLITNITIDIKDLKNNDIPTISNFSFF